MKTSLAAVAVLLAGGRALFATDFYIDPEIGDDRANGLSSRIENGNGPMKTIHRGIRSAQPGDTVHLAPVVFKESAVFYKAMGEPGKPITLDGHGATLDGGDPIDPAAWTETAPGLFRNDNMLPRLDDAMIMRWFFLWDGKMNHMGRTSKGPSAPLKKPEDLQPGEWTFVKGDSRKQPNSQQIFGAFYFKLPPGQKLADAKIVMPTRSAGVQFSGDNRHLVIRNITATHVYNDGYNLHGHCEDVLFENIRAIECGDDGISAHETAQYHVEGFVSIGNSTGICDTGASQTSYNRVFIKDCLGHDLFFLDTGKYSVSNAIVISSASRALAVSGRDTETQPCTLALDNVLIQRAGTTHDVRVARNIVLTMKRVTFENLDFQAVGGNITMERCVLRGREHPPEVLLWKDVQWHGGENLYALKSLRFDKASYTPETFAEFQKATGQETGSQWQTGSEDTNVPEGIGADVTELRKSVLPSGEKWISATK